MKSIRVYTENESIRFMTLDGIEREVSSDTPLIGNGEGAAAIAGIMGGKESEVTESTDGIIIESATFDGVAIRKSAASLGLRTDASMRYEKFLDTALTIPAIGRYI
jgi:phenylalanyl-tRNA synthetase beta chain